jgi:TonB family protein
VIVLAGATSAGAQSAAEATQAATETATEQSISEVLGQPDDDADQYSYLAQRIDRSEAASAERELETIIDQLAKDNHASHPELLRPLTLLGDAQSAQQEYGKALETYGRAVHIARVNNGLFAASQLEVVYREADTYAKLGDLTEARNREEYAYEIMKRGFQTYDPGLVTGLERLAQFYLKTHNYFAARVFFQRSMAVHRANGSDMTSESLPALRGIALTYRMERFPPFYIVTSKDTRASGPSPGLDPEDLGMQHIRINNFHEGERALQSIVQILQAQVPPEPKVLRASILELADWHLLWERANEANLLYGHIYNEMAALGENPREMFGSPTLVWFPEPRPPSPPPLNRRLVEEQGVVTLQFQITQTGRIKKLKTVHSHPPKMMDFQVRRSMRLAVFRPALSDSRPQTVDNFTYSYEFPYFPSAPRTQEPTQAPDSDLDPMQDQPASESTPVGEGDPIET